MSLWHDHALADARHADLCRQAEQRHRAGVNRLARTRRRTSPKWRLQQRVGMFLVETGLHLIIRTGERDQLSRVEFPGARR